MDAIAKDLASNGVAVKAVDWYPLDSVPEWLGAPELGQVRSVWQYNKPKMGVLFDPDFKQTNLINLGGAVIVDASGIIRWAGSPHNVGEIRKALTQIVP